MIRPSRDKYFIEIAKVVATRATCPRRQVGCVLVDANGHILATGYNGVAKGLPHCTDNNCPGASLPSGTGLDICQAIHAEQNALLQCSDVQKIEKVYCTTEPCITCTKLLMNTSAKEIIFLNEYGQEERVAKKLWVSRTGHYSWTKYTEGTYI